jgi:hypothetical protein
LPSALSDKLYAIKADFLTWCLSTNLSKNITVRLFCTISTNIGGWLWRFVGNIIDDKTIFKITGKGC